MNGYYRFRRSSSDLLVDRYLDNSGNIYSGNSNQSGATNSLFLKDSIYEAEAQNKDSSFLRESLSENATNSFNPEFSEIANEILANDGAAYKSFISDPINRIVDERDNEFNDLYDYLSQYYQNNTGALNGNSYVSPHVGYYLDKYGNVSETLNSEEIIGVFISDNLVISSVKYNVTTSGLLTNLGDVRPEACDENYEPDMTEFTDKFIRFFIHNSQNWNTASTLINGLLEYKYNYSKNWRYPSLEELQLIVDSKEYLNKKLESAGFEGINYESQGPDLLITALYEAFNLFYTINSSTGEILSSQIEGYPTNPKLFLILNYN